VIGVLLVVQQIIQRVLAFALKERAELHVAAHAEVPTVALLDRAYVSERLRRSGPPSVLERSPRIPGASSESDKTISFFV
jgi:hypothetical protein